MSFSSSIGSGRDHTSAAVAAASLRQKTIKIRWCDGARWMAGVYLLLLASSKRYQAL